MEYLFFICPRSREPIDSGLALDLSAFRQTKTVQLRLLSCPHCRMQHQLRVGDGFLTNSPPHAIIRIGRHELAETSWA